MNKLMQSVAAAAGACFMLGSLTAFAVDPPKKN